MFLLQFEELATKDDMMAVDDSAKKDILFLKGYFCKEVKVEVL